MVRVAVVERMDTLIIYAVELLFIVVYSYSLALARFLRPVATKDDEGTGNGNNEYR